MFWGESTWSTAPSAVFPCGGRRRGAVSPGSRTAPWRRPSGLRVCRPGWCRERCAGRRRANLKVDARDAALSPSPQPPPAASRVPCTGRRFAGGGARARRGHGLAADLIHQPPQGQWGLAACGRERRKERVESRRCGAGLHLEYGAVRRFPMRFEDAWSGDGGLPHGRTSRGLRTSVSRGTLKRSLTGFRNRLGRGPRVAAGAATRGYGRVPLLGTGVGMVVCEGELVVGGPRGLTHRLGNLCHDVASRPTWSTAPSAVFPCGGRRRGAVSPGSRTARRGLGV
jgi:hypothetical protein